MAATVGIIGGLVLEAPAGASAVICILNWLFG